MINLNDRIPEEGILDPSAALDVFLEWVDDLGISPYPAQEEAIAELMSGSHVVLKTPTGSGKSLVAVALHFHALARARRSVYTAPIKALVSEKFFALCETFGAENVGMMTGDGSVNRDAPIICCTAEVLSKLALRYGADTPFRAVVMDEFHYYADRDRGMAWQIPLLTMPHAQFLLMSATLGDTTDIEDDLALRTDRPVEVVSSTQRPVPLEFLYSRTAMLDTIERLVRGNKAPIYVVHFSQRQAAETAGAMMSTNITDKAEKKVLAQAMKGFRFDSPYGAALHRYLGHGVGLHHAGLLPKYRLLVEKLAQAGLLKVICGTDTLGVGINVPIRTVLFSQLCKYDGESVGILTVRDFKQIAGRAGRKGFDDQGTVVAQEPDWVIENARLKEQVASGRKKRKKVRFKSAPSRGYQHWTEDTFRKLIARSPEPLHSVFRVDHGLLLSLLQKADEEGGDGLAELHALIDDSHASAAEKVALHTRADEVLAELVSAGVVSPDTHAVDAGLQQDFSLHHSLSLFLLHALSLLDPADPGFALDAITMVEAIVDHPRAVLHAQVSHIKGRMVAAMKAEGVPYEDRMERLEGVTWPKPRAEWIYEVYNAYAKEHPWVDAEFIRPKSVVRDIIEQYASFSDYVTELRIQRAEGVLLRYLSQVYKILQQTVPAELHTDELTDALAYLRAMLARVDSSLITEWEKLAAGAADRPEEAPRPVDISSDRRAFGARVRAELHAIVRALSRRDFAEAAASVRSREDAWTADDFEEAIAPFCEEHGEVRFDGQARLAWNTILTPDGPHRWQVRQVLLSAQPEADAYMDEEVENTWSIDAVIDLRDDTNPDGPVIEVVSIGE